MLVVINKQNLVPSDYPMDVVSSHLYCKSHVLSERDFSLRGALIRLFSIEVLRKFIPAFAQILATGWFAEERYLDANLFAIRVGDLIVNSYYRSGSFRRGRLSKARTLAKCLYEIARHVDMAERFAPDGVMLNHVTYVAQGSQLRTVLQNGGFGVHFKANFVHFYGKYDDAISAGPRKLGIWPEPLPRWEEFAAERLQGFNAITLNSYNNKRTIGWQEFCTEIGIDAEKPTVIIAGHCFTDANHNPEQPITFVSFYQWIKRTYNIVCNISEVNWIFKEHPNVDQYGEAGYLQELIPETDNVKVVPAIYNNLSLFPHIRTVITAVGTIALEAACHGVRPVVVGRPIHLDADLAVKAEPANYAEVLARCGQMERLTADEQRRARQGLIARDTVNRDVGLFRKSTIRPATPQEDLRRIEDAEFREMRSQHFANPSAFWAVQRQLIDAIDAHTANGAAGA